MAYRTPYDYPFGKYVVIKEFEKVDEKILEKIKAAVKNHIKIEKDLVRRKNDVETDYVDDFQKATENLDGIFKNYPWVEKSLDFEDGKFYLISQYKLVAIAELFVKKMSSVEAAFEAAYLDRFSLGGSRLYTPGVSQRLVVSAFWRKKDRSQFKETITHNPLMIFLVVKYLKQLGYDKNPVKDKEFCKSFEKSLNNLEEKIELKKLTKEEWDERLKHKIRVQY